MLGFFINKRKNGESSGNSSGTATIGLGRTLVAEPINTNEKTQDVLDQERVVAELEKEFANLPGHVQAAIGTILMQARQSLNCGCPVSGATMAKLNEVIANEQCKALLQSTFAGILCCSDVSVAATLGTGARHGLDGRFGPVRAGFTPGLMAA